MAKLENKVAVVTGVAAGLGEAIARRFIAEGAHVVGTDIDPVRGAEVVAELGEHASFVEHDVASEAGWEQVAARVAAQHGHVDVLVNNAGITRMGSVEDISIEDFDRTRAVSRLPFAAAPDESARCLDYQYRVGLVIQAPGGTGRL